jgi:hypothetical protein
MDQEVLVAFIGVLPDIVWVSMIVVLVALLRKPIIEGVVPRLTRLSFGGVTLDLRSSDVERVVKDRAAATTDAGMIPQAAGEHIVARASLVAPIMRDRAVLWVDPNPMDNRGERRLLHDLGVFVDAVTSVEAALEALADRRDRIFDAVITNNSGGAGERLLGEMRAAGHGQPVIFYILNLDPERGVPVGAFGITTWPDELLHLVMDAVERTAGIALEPAKAPNAVRTSS